MFSGKLIIFSAPSGSGKTTIVKYLIDKNPILGFSISACTRPQRSNEINGFDYYFLTPYDFQEKVKRGEFVEWEEVYENGFYGTLESEIDRLWSLGKHVIFDVDVKGALNLKRLYQEKALSIFVKVPSYEILEARLKNRGTESDASMELRLAKVREEMNYEHKFDKVLLNNDLDIAFVEAQQMVDKFLS